MKVYKVWDTIEKSHYQEEFLEEGAAHAMIDGLFDAGRYSDHPCTVLEVNEYEYGKFLRTIQFSPTKADEYNDALQTQDN